MRVKGGGRALESGVAPFLVNTGAGGEGKGDLSGQTSIRQKNVLVGHIANSGMLDRGVICATSLSRGSSHTSTAFALRVQSHS